MFFKLKIGGGFVTCFQMLILLYLCLEIRVNIKRRLSITVATISSLFASSASNADFRGVSLEILDSGLGIGTTFRFYVNVDPGDQVLGVFGDSSFPALFAVSDCYQHFVGYYGPPNEVLFEFFPSLEFDSFVSIGLLTDTDDAMLSLGIDWSYFESDGNIYANNGGWFTTQGSLQSYEVDGRVLIAQFTGGLYWDFPTFTIQGRNADSTSWIVQYQRPLSCGDEDEDGACWHDNCYLYNPDQADCNVNGIGDVCELASGTSGDWNEDGIPDECQSLADTDDDGEVTVLDLVLLISNWGQVGDPGILGDVTWDGMVNNSDLLEVLSAWGIIYSLDQAGACCIDQNCDMLLLAECLAAGGFHLGLDTNCSKNTCIPNAPDCNDDINGDGYIDVYDLIEMIAVWPGCWDPKCYADINGDGVLNINDMMYLLSLNWDVLCE